MAKKVKPSTVSDRLRDAMEDVEIIENAKSH